MAKELSKRIYKFRALDKNAIDILVNNRLYLASWELLNDPHEAQLIVQTPGPDYHMNPKRLKERGIPVDFSDARVCSLSATWTSNLLWSHYADGGAGIAIGLELPDIGPFEIVDVSYDDNVPIVAPPIDTDAVLQALSHKSKEWAYEKEIRIVSFDTAHQYVSNIAIKEVIFGLRTERDDIETVKKIVNNHSVDFWQVCKKPGKYSLNKTDRRNIKRGNGGKSLRLVRAGSHRSE